MDLIAYTRPGAIGLFRRMLREQFPNCEFREGVRLPYRCADFFFQWRRLAVVIDASDRKAWKSDSDERMIGGNAFQGVRVLRFSASTLAENPDAVKSTLCAAMQLSPLRKSRALYFRNLYAEEKRLQREAERARANATGPEKFEGCDGTRREVGK